MAIKKLIIFISSMALVIVLLNGGSFNYSPETPGIKKELNRTAINKVTGLWKPNLNHVQIVAGNWIQYLNAIPYLFLIIIFFRKTKLTNPVMILAILMTIGAVIQYAHPFHREFIMPLILLEVIREFHNA